MALLRFVIILCDQEIKASLGTACKSTMILHGTNEGRDISEMFIIPINFSDQQCN